MRQGRIVTNHWNVSFFFFYKMDKSLNICNSWKKYDEHTKIAVMRYESYEAEVDMTLISSIPTTGDIVQCLGEVLEEVRHSHKVKCKRETHRQK